QTTPAIGMPPMNPMTTMRLRFMSKKTPNAERGTPNTESSKSFSELEVGRWTLGVGRSLFVSLEFLHFDCRISGDDRVGRNALGNDRACRDHRVVADRDAFQDDRAHPNPNVVA